MYCVSFKRVSSSLLLKMSIVILAAPNDLVFYREIYIERAIFFF